MEKESALGRAIVLLGGLSATALALNIKSYQVVQQWKKSRVPADRCPAIEKATAGAVRCEDLRPDVDWAYLRNSATATPSRIAPITCGASDPRHAERRDGDRRDDHTKEAA